jgi:hypothetical protein
VVDQIQNFLGIANAHCCSRALRLLPC